MIYFDNNATTKTFDCVADAMRPFLTTHYANLSSAFARLSGIPETVERAKVQICQCLGIGSTGQLVFTSGATESNNLAIRGAAKANPRRRHIITSNIEHPSVSETINALHEEGYRVSVLPSGNDGAIRPEDLQPLLSTDTLLVSVMVANNESGTIQPITTLAATAKQFDPIILVHTDATQAVGKIPINLESDFVDVDLLSLSAHKFHGPKGAGALYVRDLENISSILHGGGQQKGIRSGTENPGGIVGMAVALAELAKMTDALKRTQRLVKELEQGILTIVPSAIILGANANRLPNTLFVCFPGVDAEDLVDQMAIRNIAISTGSACAFGAQRSSHVAVALGLTYDQAKSCVRLSLSVYSTEHEVCQFLRVLGEVLLTMETRFDPPKEAIS